MGSASAMPSAGHAAGSARNTNTGRIGPNAILQVFNVLDERLGPEKTELLVRRAGLRHHRLWPPATMVDERDVVNLHQTVRTALPQAQASAVLWQAGLQTADYILANRIPGLVQIMLRTLPARLASPLLLRAIAQNAWTFAGSGTFSYQTGKPAVFTLIDCPACSDVYGTEEPCSYFVATFQGLFRALVHRRTTITDEGATSPDGRERNFRLDWPS